MAINWTVTKEDSEMIHEIATKAADRLGGATFEWTMDITATHANGCPLDLERMLDAADSFDFAHDLAGIRRHINRTTGEIGGFFVPRFASRRED